MIGYSTICRTTAELGRLLDSESSPLQNFQDVLSEFTVDYTTIGFHTRQSTFYPGRFQLPRYSCRPKLLVDKKYRECGLASGFLRSFQMEDDEAFKFSSSCLSGAGFSSKCKYNLPFLVTMQNLNLILTMCRPHRQHSSGIYEIQCGRYNEGFSDTLRQRASLRDTLFNSTDTRHWFLRGSR